MMSHEVSGGDASLKHGTFLLDREYKSAVECDANVSLSKDGCYAYIPATCTRTAGQSNCAT